MVDKKIVDFTDLAAWKEAHKLVLLVYKFWDTFPKREQFRLIEQMCRASISVTSNIAEGFGRYTYREKVHFYYFASGSISELKNQVIAAYDLSYLDINNYSLLIEQIEITQKLLKGLIKKSKSLFSL